MEELSDVTKIVSDTISKSRVSEGLCVVYCPHTTAAVTVNENADPDVKSDMLKSPRDIVQNVGFTHSEGKSPAHVKSSYWGCSQTIPVSAGKLVLGA